MDVDTSIPIIKDFFYITYVENDGAAFSMLSGARWFFVVLTIVVAAVIIAYYIKMPKTKYYKITRLSLLIIISGAVGNFIDRLLYGSVTDMLHFIFFGYSFAVFNFADICVCCGVALLVFIMLFFGKDDILEDS
jgi:signal peptidase II